MILNRISCLNSFRFDIHLSLGLGPYIYYRLLSIVGGGKYMAKRISIKSLLQRVVLRKPRAHPRLVLILLRACPRPVQRHYAAASVISVAGASATPATQRAPVVVSAHSAPAQPTFSNVVSGARPKTTVVPPAPQRLTSIGSLQNDVNNLRPRLPWIQVSKHSVRTKSIRVQGPS